MNNNDSIGEMNEGNQQNLMNQNNQNMNNPNQDKYGQTFMSQQSNQFGNNQQDQPYNNQFQNQAQPPQNNNLYYSNNFNNQQQPSFTISQAGGNQNQFGNQIDNNQNSQFGNSQFNNNNQFVPPQDQFNNNNQFNPPQGQINNNNDNNYDQYNNNNYNNNPPYDDNNNNPMMSSQSHFQLSNGFNTKPNEKSVFSRKKKGGMNNAFLPYDGGMSEPKNQEAQYVKNPVIDGILLNVQGLIEKAEFSNGDSFYCKYEISYGVDWTVVNGSTSGQSQQACQGENASNLFVWNFPFEIGFKSNNPTGWPQVVISIYGPDFWGREVIKAYGLVHIPTTPGSHVRTLQLFSPLSSSIIINLLGIALGQNAELIKVAESMSTGEGREIIRTQSEGSMTIRFNVQLANMEELGYNV